MAVPPSSIFIPDIPLNLSEVDAGVREIVAALNTAGFRTWASCDGHEAGAPWVEVFSEAPEATRPELCDWLRECGLHAATVSLYWQVNASVITGPLIHIEWWTKDTVAQWRPTPPGPAAT